MVAQQAVFESIKTAIDNNRLPHALLIAGSEGTGGLSLAYAAAQYLMCPEKRNGEACQECPQCIQIQKLQHPDLHFVYPIADKDANSTDYLNEWRDSFLNNQYLTFNEWIRNFGGENKQAHIFVNDANYIIKELSTKPYESDYRVMIIWLPEMMRVDAANKLLKIIEEPYEKTHFFFVSNNPEAIIGTILSRLQRINLPPLQDGFVTLNEDDRTFFFEKFCQMMRLSYAKKLFEMKDWSDEMSALSRDKLKAYFQYAQNMIRENFIMNFHCQELNFMNEDEAKFSSRFYSFVNEKNVEGIMAELEKAEKDVTQNVNEKMILFDLSLKLIMLLKLAEK